MITHVVIFWLDKPYAQNREDFFKGAKTLGNIPDVLEYRCGVAVPSNRGVVDDSFAVGISMTFKDQAVADQYQNHPIHLEFVNKYVKTMVKRFVVYDWN